MKLSHLLALGAVAISTALAAPSAHAAGPIVKFQTTSNPKLLSDIPSIGFATMQSPSSLANQRWERLDGPGAFEYYRDVGTGKCLRASPTNNVFVRTVTCNFTDDAASRQQQWVLSGRQLANRDRLINNNPANSLTVDFNNVNSVVGMAAFTGKPNQSWLALAG